MVLVKKCFYNLFWLFYIFCIILVMFMVINICGWKFLLGKGIITDGIYVVDMEDGRWIIENVCYYKVYMGFYISCENLLNDKIIKFVFGL